jgi:hypothetical protein
MFGNFFPREMRFTDTRIIIENRPGFRTGLRQSFLFVVLPSSTYLFTAGVEGL